MSKKEKANASGIYAIICKVTNKPRIGQASEIDKRWSQYRAELRGNKFGVKELQEDWNKYGEENFEYIIIEKCPQKKLKELENYYILKYNAINDGYNSRLNDLSKPKKIRRGKEAANYKEERSLITAGELNGHCTKLSKLKVFELLDMLKDGVNRDIIANKFDIYPAYICRIGKDRWVKVYQEWLEIEETTIFEDIAVSTHLDVNTNVEANVLANLV